MKACVTGATGFVRAHLARTLVAEGHAVRVVYEELIAAGAFADERASGLSRIAGAVGAASRLGLPAPLDLAQRVPAVRRWSL